MFLMLNFFCVEHTPEENDDRTGIFRKLRPSCEPWIIDGEGVVYLDGACPVDGQQTPDSKEGPEGSLKQLKRRLTASGLFL